MPLRKHRLEIVVVESVTSQSNFSSLVESQILSGGIKGGGTVIENNCIKVRINRFKITSALSVATREGGDYSDGAPR